MVLKLDGNSDIGAPVRSSLCYLTCIKHSIVSSAVTNRIFFVQKDIFSFLPAHYDLSCHLIYVPWFIQIQAESIILWLCQSDGLGRVADPVCEKKLGSGFICSKISVAIELFYGLNLWKSKNIDNTFFNIFFSSFRFWCIR